MRHVEARSNYDGTSFRVSVKEGEAVSGRYVCFMSIIITLKLGDKNVPSNPKGWPVRK